MGKKMRNSCLPSLLLLLVAASPAQAADITVDGTDCTLSDAINTANDGGSYGTCTAGLATGADTIILDADVTLTAALPQITSTIIIEGDGHFISGNNNPMIGTVLIVNSTGNLTLKETTITGGNKTISSGGGGIYNIGALHPDELYGQR